jgi:hypothetical protein
MDTPVAGKKAASNSVLAWLSSALRLGISPFQALGLPANTKLASRSWLLEYNEGDTQINAIERRDDGTTIAFAYNHADGKANGKAVEMLDDGTRIEFAYEGGVRQGEALATLKNETTIRFFYKDGVPEGEAVEIKPDGTRIEFKIVEGVVQGMTYEIRNGERFDID